MDSIIKNRVALVVLSCDTYSDLWPMFFYFFEKNWPDCSLDKYIVTNNITTPNTDFKFLCIGKDSSWSDTLIKSIALLKDKYEYLLITLEDLPLMKRVDDESFRILFDEFINARGNFLSLAGNPNKTSKYNDFFGKIDPGSLYRPSCVYSLWKIEVLERIVCIEENAWEFERYGAVRSDKYNNFFTVEPTHKLIFSNTVIKGLWVRSEYKRVCKSGYLPNISQRKVYSKSQEIKLKVNVFLFKLFNNYIPIPWKIRRFVVFSIKGYNKH